MEAPLAIVTAKLSKGVMPGYTQIDLIVDLANGQEIFLGEIYAARESHDYIDLLKTNRIAIYSKDGSYRGNLYAHHIITE